jgi:hypothetical protein
VVLSRSGDLDHGSVAAPSDTAGAIAAIGSISDTEALLRGEAGTTVTLETARVG